MLIKRLLLGLGLLLFFLATYAQNRFSYEVYAGIAYHQTTTQQRPANTRFFGYLPLNPMYSPVQGIALNYDIASWLRGQMRVGYASVGLTDDLYRRDEFHYGQLQLDVLIHPVQAPAWMQRLWIGGGLRGAVRLGQHLNLLNREFIFPDSQYHRLVGGIQGRLRYQIGQHLWIGLQYNHDLTPYYTANIEPNDRFNILFLADSYVLTFCHDIDFFGKKLIKP